MRVERKYWLKEVRSESTWTRIRAELETRKVLGQHRHYELLFTPYAGTRGDYLFLVTTRDYTPMPTGTPDDRRWRHPLIEVLAAFPPVSSLLGFVLNLVPSWTPAILESGLKALVDSEYTDVSYRVLNVGAANLLHAYSSEIAVPCDDRGLHIQAVEKVFAVAKRHRELGTA